MPETVRARRDGSLAAGPGVVLWEANDTTYRTDVVARQAARIASRFRLSLPHAVVVAELALTPIARRA